MKTSMKCIFISIHLPQLMAMVKSPKYKFPYSKGKGGLSAHKLHREDKIHLANKIVVDGCDNIFQKNTRHLRPLLGSSSNNSVKNTLTVFTPIFKKRNKNSQNGHDDQKRDSVTFEMSGAIE